MASLCRLSLPAADGKNRILFANPDNLDRADGKTTPGRGRDRKNLTVKLSYDECQTWPVARSLDAGPSGYSDLAVGADHTIYCLYEQGGREAGSAFRPSLTLARFNLEWLAAGQDSPPVRAGVEQPAQQRQRSDFERLPPRRPRATAPCVTQNGDRAHGQAS